MEGLESLGCERLIIFALKDKRIYNKWVKMIRLKSITNGGERKGRM